MVAAEHKRALILDAGTLSSLAVIRSLGRHGYVCDVGETFNWNLSRFSKYVDETFTYPDAGEQPEAFNKAILSRLHLHEYDVLIPTRDSTTLELARRQEELASLTNTYIAPTATIERFLDKAETLKLAEEVGIPIPRTWYPERTDPAMIKTEVEYPVLIRPRRTSGSRGIIRVDSPDTFNGSYQRVEKAYGKPIIQELIDKTGYTTACVLLNEEGDEVATFSYERKKEYPLRGGPTVVGVSTDDERAKVAATRLLQAGDWYGPAEVEFIIDQDGTPRLLEVNPRFWMPVQLAISSGVDFPFYVAQLAQTQTVTQFTDFDTGVTYRWILPYEILHAFSARRPIGGIRDMISTAGGKVCYGTISKSDPLPILGTFVQSLTFLIDQSQRDIVLNRDSVDTQL